MAVKNRRTLGMWFTLLCLLLGLSDAVIAKSDQQNRRVRGTVLSITDNTPLEGASVRIQGRGRSTITNSAGEFSLNGVRPNDILVIAHLGYTTQEYQLSGAQEVKILLVPSAEDLEEVVVVGYGTIAKSDFTGSSSRADMEGVEENRFTSPLEALQGRMAGVQVITNTGEAGGGITFNVRGVTSMSGGRPLIVVDGQPIESEYGATQAGMDLEATMTAIPMDPLAGLNPADIESIEVLKDASSIAIYGSRGADGVVLITTKSGRAGKDRISYTSRLDYNTMPKYLDVLNSREYMLRTNEARENMGLTPTYTEEQIENPEIDVNWQREVLQSRYSHNQQLAVSGRDDRTRYMLSGNFSEQNSMIKNRGFDRYSLRANYQRNVSDKFIVSLNANMAMMNRQFGLQSNAGAIPNSSVVMTSLMWAPNRRAYDEEGEIDDQFANNPLLISEIVKDHSRVRQTTANATLRYNFNRNLWYTLKVGVNDNYTLRNVYHPRGTLAGDAANGVAVRGDNWNTNYLVDNLLNFNKVLYKKHRINAVGGFSYQFWDYKSSSMTARDFPSDALGYYNFRIANAPGIMRTVYQERALQSVLARGNYAYDRRYLLTLTGRADGSSRLAAGRKWGSFYSLGLGWNLHNESFFKADFVNELKLRGSYGVTGMERIAIGATQATFTYNMVNVGDVIIPGYVQSDFDNPYPTWESTTQANVGMDVELWKNRLAFSVDLYRKRTTDLLHNLQLPPSATYSSYPVNMGEVLNEGIDIEGNLSDILRGKSPVKWNAGFNLSVLRNEMVHVGVLEALYGQHYFAGGGMLLGQPVHTAVPGGPLPSFWGYKTNGIYQNADEIAAGPEASTARPGDVRWVDVNGDGQITDDDKTIIGNPFPDFTYGFNTNLAYKRFTLSMAFMGSQGNQLLNMNSWILEANSITNAFTSTSRAYEGAWRGEGTSNKYPRLTNDSPRLSGRFPDWMVEDASFFRMQSLVLGYTFHLPQYLGASSLRAYVSGTNLFTITKYSGLDPAINAFGHSVLNSGVDLGTLPQPRTYSVGFEWTF